MSLRREEGEGKGGGEEEDKQDKGKDRASEMKWGGPPRFQGGTGHGKANGP